MRTPQDLAVSSGSGSSATPIYDALYAEYRRQFRALPGDRSGEEDLGFTAFAPFGGGSRHSSGWQVVARRERPALPPAPRRGQ
ncbi:hypothetical protein [Streptomyces sp. GC420]|uniref:hypothetical protein n=1 Tax=Streptomyces sp. GC420 TaxID=2697568 RepID=UPI001AA182BF|nr:hypothetical protein [Streptomyces sp. GC420]